MNPTCYDRRVEAVVHRLSAVRILPVLTVEEPQVAADIARALAAGGIDAVEITLRTPSAFAAVRAVQEVDDLLVGVGTVLTVDQLGEAAAAGASFAVSPGTNDAVVASASEFAIPFFPGVATATEVDRARTLGLRVLKIFPAAALGGPEFLRALCAPFPDVKLIPTGGVNQRTLAGYLALRQVVAVGGSWLTPADLVQRRAYREIERLAAVAVRAVAEAEGGL